MDILIKNVRTVLPDDEKIFTVRESNIYIQNKCIAGIDSEPEGFSAETVLDGTGKLLMPGLVNGHTHAYMTVFRNYADDLAFTDWLFGNILPLEDRLLPEDAYWGTMLGYMEMLRTGTTCSLDMYIFPDEAAKARQECGIRAVMSRGLTGSSEDPGGGERRLREAVAEIEKWKGSEGLSFMLAPHAPYTCDPGYLREVVATADQLDVGLNIHVSESQDEINQINEKYGCSPVELLDEAGVLKSNTVAAHCVYLSDSDIEIMAQRGISVATNPVSNLKLGNGFAPMQKLLARGINVCLGTDGAASNNALNMFRDLNYLTLLHKGTTRDAGFLSAYEGLKIATANGAKALGLGGVTGEIRKGMKADLILLDIEKPWMKPENNLISALAYSANGSEVDTVLVDGKILYKNGEYMTIDSQRVYYEVEKICRRLGMRQ
ncbi:MAG: amidohydrolase [Clostridiales bacterium]|nr:amidohydrolase [Clostridiales bacterium]